MTLTQPWTVRRDGSRDALSRDAIRRQRAGRGRHPDLNPTLDGDGADGAQDTHGALQIWTTTASFCPQGQNGAVVNAFDSTFRHHGFDSYGLTHGKKMAAEIRCEDSERSQLTNRCRLWRQPTLLITHDDMGVTRAANTHPQRRGADGTRTLTQPWTVRRYDSRDALSRDAIRRQRAGRGWHPDTTP